MPKDFDPKPLADLQSINRAFNTVDATTWGSCEGACYVKQVGVTVPWPCLYHSEAGRLKG